MSKSAVLLPVLAATVLLAVIGLAGLAWSLRGNRTVASSPAESVETTAAKATDWHESFSTFRAAIRVSQPQKSSYKHVVDFGSLMSGDELEWNLKFSKLDDKGYVHFEGAALPEPCSLVFTPLPEEKERFQQLKPGQAVRIAGKLGGGFMDWQDRATGRVVASPIKFQGISLSPQEGDSGFVSAVKLEVHYVVVINDVRLIEPANLVPGKPGEPQPANAAEATDTPPDAP